MIDRASITAWLEAFAAAIAEHKDMLTQLDSAIGDADHGVNMHRGLQAALTKLPAIADKDIGTIFKTVSMTFISSTGGTAGPLYGTLFLQLAAVSAGKTELTWDEFVRGFSAGVDGIAARGKAQAGDKTMLDALLPAVAELRANDAGTALVRAEEAAARGRDATIPLIARRGRASYLGDRSAGHQDPGATSIHLLIQTAAATLRP